MKRLLSSLLLALALLAGAALLSPAVRSASREITEAILQGRAWSFTALQTFSGGINPAFTRIAGSASYLNTGTAQLLPQQIDFTMANPASAPTFSFSGFGSCSNTQTYRFYVTWGNQSGETAVSPASADGVPNDGSDTTTITRPSIDSAATHWRSLYSKASEGHGTIRNCSTSIVWVSAATTTQSCGCSAAGPVYSASNGTGPLIMLDPRDGEIRFPSDPASGTPVFGSGVNRVYFGQSAPRWSNDSGTTKVDLLSYGATTVTVCKAGCRYSTVTSALAAITDASTTKRYTIVIAPGDYDEDVVAKSYVTFQGVNRHTSRLRGLSTSSGVGAIKVNSGITGVEVVNLTIGGATPIRIEESTTTRTTVDVVGSILGIIDGSEGPSGKTIDGIFEVAITAGHRDISVIGTIYRSVFDFVRIGEDSSYTGVGNRFVGAFDAASAFMRVWENTQGGSQITEISPTVELVTGGSVVTIGLSYPGQDGGSRPSISRILDGDIRITSTDASRSASTTCFLTAGDSPTASDVLDFSGSRCEISMADSATILTGISVTGIDADRASTKVRWSGGEIVLTGGATRTDVNNAETTAGFSLVLDGVSHAGNGAGAGAITVFNSPLTNGTIRNSCLATAPASCSAGDWYCDTSGASCHCKAAGTWEDMTDAVVGVGGCV